MTTETKPLVSNDENILKMLKKVLHRIYKPFLFYPLDSLCTLVYVRVRLLQLCTSRPEFSGNLLSDQISSATVPRYSATLTLNQMYGILEKKNFFHKNISKVLRVKINTAYCWIIVNEWPSNNCIQEVFMRFDDAVQIFSFSYFLQQFIPWTF